MSASAWLDPAPTTLALSWRLDRRDGGSIGLTTHDRDLPISGIVHAASPGLLPSTVRQSDGVDVDTLYIQGAPTREAITADDLLAGHWMARRSVCSPRTGAIRRRRRCRTRGEIGSVAIRDGAITTELRKPTALLERPVAEQTARDCRAAPGGEG